MCVLGGVLFSCIHLYLRATSLKRECDREERNPEMDKETGEEESGELDQVELTWIFCCVWVCSLICQIYEVVVFVLCFCVFVLCL